jgi:hypothetical protein
MKIYPRLTVRNFGVNPNKPSVLWEYNQKMRLLYTSGINKPLRVTWSHNTNESRDIIVRVTGCNGPRWPIPPNFDFFIIDIKHGNNVVGTIHLPVNPSNDMHKAEERLQGFNLIDGENTIDLFSTKGGSTGTSKAWTHIASLGIFEVEIEIL